MKYLRDYMEDAQTELFQKTGSFFAFGNDQFNKKKKEGVVYVYMGHGLICPKENAQELIDGLNNIHTQSIKDDFEENGAEAIIEREYFNHETQITGDNMNVIDLMRWYKEFYPEQFTDEIILNVCRNSFNKAVKNDWF